MWRVRWRDGSGESTSVAAQSIHGESQPRPRTSTELRSETDTDSVGRSLQPTQEDTTLGRYLLPPTTYTLITHLLRSSHHALSSFTSHLVHVSTHRWSLDGAAAAGSASALASHTPFVPISVHAWATTIPVHLFLPIHPFLSPASCPVPALPFLSRFSPVSVLLCSLFRIAILLRLRPRLPRHLPPSPASQPPSAAISSSLPISHLVSPLSSHPHIPPLPSTPPSSPLSPPAPHPPPSFSLSAPFRPHSSPVCMRLLLSRRRSSHESHCQTSSCTLLLLSSSHPPLPRLSPRPSPALSPSPTPSPLRRLPPALLPPHSSPHPHFPLSLQPHCRSRCPRVFLLPAPLVLPSSLRYSRLPPRLRRLHLVRPVRRWSSECDLPGCPCRLRPTRAHLAGPAGQGGGFRAPLVGGGVGGGGGSRERRGGRGASGAPGWPACNGPGAD